MSAVDERGVEVVARCTIGVVAVLHDAAGVVEGGALHGQQRGTQFLVEQLGFLAIGRLGADPLSRQPNVHPPRP